MLILDTAVLIWGVQGAAQSSQQSEIVNAKAFLAGRRSQGDMLGIPAVVLAEYLVGIPTGSRDEHARQIISNFPVLPFDAAAAVIAAGLLPNKHEIERVRLETGSDAKHIKADVQIIATAIANQASAVVSNDAAMARLAQARVRVMTIPKILTQAELQYPDASESP